MSYRSNKAWATTERGNFNVGSAIAAATNTLYSSGNLAVASAGSGYGAFWFDPADIDAKFVRVRLVVLTSTIAPAVNFTATLSPVTSLNGGSNTRPGVATLGTAVASAVINTPAASGSVKADSASAAAPAAGLYVLTIAWSGTTAANSQVDGSVEFQARGA